MLVGSPPYYAKSKDQIFENIKSSPLEFPRDVSVVAKDLISKLLERNPKQRLVNLEAIKAHAFFDNVNWSAVYHKLGDMPRVSKFRYALAQNDTELFKQGKPGNPVPDWSFNNKL